MKAAWATPLRPVFSFTRHPNAPSTLVAFLFQIYCCPRAFALATLKAHCFLPVRSPCCCSLLREAFPDHPNLKGPYFILFLFLAEYLSKLLGFCVFFFKSVIELWVQGSCFIHNDTRPWNSNGIHKMLRGYLLNKGSCSSQKN